MAPGAKRKSLDHALASFPAPGGGGAATPGGGGGGGGGAGDEACEVEAREGRKRCSPPPRRRRLRRRCLESDAAISEVREGQEFGVWTSGHVDGGVEGRHAHGNFAFLGGWNRNRDFVNANVYCL